MGRSRHGLAPWLMLAYAISGAWAGKRAFNIHDDLLAYPQYQVVFPDDYLLESQAKELLQSQAGAGHSDPNHQSHDTQVYTGNDQTDGATRGHDEPNGLGYTYEEMILDDRRLLCQIPRVAKDDLNTTSSQPNKADEQKELARATDRGLELLREMEGKCMYYFSGWWSYSFCYQKQVKQFHALPAGRGIPHYPPVEDTNTHAFILGRFPDDPTTGTKENGERKPTGKTEMAELHTKGGRHLRGGTKCDLTGRDRRVEVQFHCHPQSTDQIGWIKELTTCSYLMVIYTPRLCDDVAFLPPQQEEVHNIECREVLLPEEIPEWEAVKEWYLAHQLTHAAAAAQSDVQVVGGIEVGGRKLVGGEGKQIEKGRVASAGEERVEVVARRENGEVKRMPRQTLKKYDLDPEKVEDMKQRLEEIAGDKDWTLEVVETNGVVKFQGVVDTEDEDEAEAETKADSQSPNQDGDHLKDQTQPSQESKEAEPESGDGRTPEQATPGKEPESEGSEETFKDEL
ncbi:hypothetical protein N7492_009367 [Penicillium capsulatum]|uniref:Endoplasmic reticulum lectin n=1 Tax=Penicillium capsulatum TaxID=69766 RepID=A0A9W9HUD7_9EURO|nr:hypothetical protein N7492_009367 [Penicillium capsulatum]KAJ6106760.1 hypothetical protein N7512_010277 [Penicillium capsulatum]